MSVPTLLEQAAPQLSNAWRGQYLDRLITWFESHRRDLPWRKTSDPYAIWISESMLQQTQVATVIDYYQRFMARFPTVDDLAAADEPEVLAMWAGLGYYRRARQLHAAARIITEQHGSCFPSELHDLLTLPGIGRYTAGAIASIAHARPAPIVEANTQRLYARLIALEDELQSPRSQELLWSFAQWQLEHQPQQPHPSKARRSKPKNAPLVAVDNLPGTINQAAMELGSLICKPTTPQCLVCPIASLCASAQRGLQHRIPRPKPPKTFTSLHHVALVIARRKSGADQWLMRCNPEGAWWTGLWDFPRVDVTELRLVADKKATVAKEPNDKKSITKRSPLVIEVSHARLIERATEEQLQLAVTLGTARSDLSLSHGVTRYRIRVDCFEATAPTTPKDRTAWQWCNKQTLLSLPLTASAKKMASKLW